MPNSKQVNWTPVIFLVTYHVLLLVLLPFYLWYHTPSVGLLLATFFLFIFSGLSITAGYHRYYAHRTYRTNSMIETILLFFASMTAQSSALRWSFEHRIHHAHVDTDQDPYSIKKGFWYAHCLWLMELPKKIEDKVVSDLLKNKLVVFQHHYCNVLLTVSNLIVILMCGWLFNDYFGAFVFAFLLRMFALHHCTWFINSIAHTWGEKPFCQELSAVDNYFISMLTFGEGYHNFHHTFANDYRNGIRWYHFDPTKWVIWTLNKLGLAHSLKKTDPVVIEKRVILESKDLLLEQLKEICHTRREEFEKIVQELSDRMVAKIAQFNQLKEEYMRIKQTHSSADMLIAIRKELKHFRKTLREDWQQWKTVYHSIMTLKTLPQGI